MKYTRLLSRTMRYIVGALLVFLTVHIGIQYGSYTSIEEDDKTGTFVEALTPWYEISYVPYAQISAGTRIYQSMFYDACLDYTLQDGRIDYRVDACDVETTNNKQYIIRPQLRNRPDGDEMTIDDIYATYKNVLIDNVWSIPSFATYKDVAIEKRDQDIVVTFPEASIDNRILFTYFILPVELTTLEFEDYRTRASRESYGADCARIQEGTKDIASLVLDVSACAETNMNNYQLKYLPTWTNPEAYSYINMIKWSSTTQVDFVHHDVPNRNYMFLFFNNESKKLSPKIQRALAWYINTNFHNDQTKDYLMDDKIMFTQFLSVGDSVATYIASKNPNLPVDKFDLEKVNVTPLPTEVTIKKGDKPVYFLESINGYKTTRMFVDDAYDSITVSHNKWAAFAPRTYNKNTKSFYYTVAPYNNNLVEWLNEYIIKGKKNGKDTVVADIDIYFLTTPLQENPIVKEEDKLRILYVYHPVIDRVVSRLQSLFEEAWVADYMLFDGYDNPDSFEGKLLSQEYDMVLRIVDVGQRNDLRSLFVGKNPVLNPSLYSKNAFVSALEQYAGSPDNQQIIDNINTIYGKDMPFMVLGELFDTFAIKSDIEKQISDDAYDYTYDLYREIYRTITLGKTRRIVWKDLFNLTNIKHFYQTGGDRTVVVPTTATVIDETMQTGTGNVVQ